MDDTHCREEKRNMKQHKPALHVSAALNAKNGSFSSEFFKSHYAGTSGTKPRHFTFNSDDYFLRVTN